ncbi:MAG: DUF5685 family protein [Oscillospiraceae bacterium]|nr:DUF5685 family protein [Oscillospiraceae bacterium]
MCEFDTYQSVYCGLCKQIGKDYGHPARLTLNYDFTFLSLLGMSLSQDKISHKQQICIANPIKKRVCAQGNKITEYCAATAMLIIYYKLKDNLADNGFFGKILMRLLNPFAALARNKARKTAPQTDIIISKSMELQKQVEKSKFEGIDAAAHPTSEAMGLICRQLADIVYQQQEEETHEAANVLYRFGYLLGRYVYFTDALDDLQKDRKTGNFNPFLKKIEQDNLLDFNSYANEVINLTVSQIAGAYELLNINNTKPILDNIIYLGLKNTVSSILAGDFFNTP